ncbi:MAG: ABC transporter permease [Tannerella sp.]|nr:ABC transporter permease [Tannerella sp.]
MFVKNLFSVLRRYKFATVLNVLGLSTAFATFMVIMSQVHYERTFDRCHPKAERIYRVDMNTQEWSNIHARAFVDAVIASSSHIEEGTILTPMNYWMDGQYIIAGDSMHKQGFRESFVTCYPSITRIFGFSFTEGDADCLRDPGKVIIPQSMARRFFGDEPATGKAIHSNDAIFTREERDFTVGGVYRDFPGNTQIDNVIYTAIGSTMQGNWNAKNFICYLLLDSREAAAEFEEEFNRTFDFSALGNVEAKPAIRLLPVTSLYYEESFKSGSETALRILSFIALLIVIVAAINFTNFSIALAPVRMKSLNMRRILGGTAGSLRRSLLGEALTIAAGSWLFALVIVELLGHYKLLPFIEADVSPLHNIAFTLITGGVALATGLVAGLYPAWYMTSFRPVMTVKGNFASSPSGRILRTGLTGFQYVISIGLIIAALFIQLQNRYMRGFDQGFDKEHIAVVSINNSIYRNSRDVYIDRLKEYAGIEDVAFSKQKLGASDGYTFYTPKYIDREFYCYMLEVSANFLQVMGIPVLEGRDFFPSDETAEHRLAFIPNKTLQDEVQMEPGGAIELWAGGSVVGIAGDVKFTSLRQASDPILFTVNSGVPLTVSYIRLAAGVDVFDAVSHIRRSVAAIDPTFPVEVEFYDQIFDRLYRKEESLNRSITMLGLLAVIISVTGVFGLVLFETQYRRKEIGIRKVFGSTTREILALFNRKYFRIVCVCFVLAAPVAYWGVARWLENFAFKTPLYWWVFAAAFMIVTALTLITVTVQNWRAASVNPVESVKSE